MRRATSCLIIGFVVTACGGSDFQAASIDEAGAVGPDATAPMVDGPEEDGAPTFADEADEWRGDNGVTDATTERASGDSSGQDADLDAAPEQKVEAASDATCDALVDFYRDRDKDGFGSTSDHVLACSPPSDGTDAWVTEPGDCRDDLPAVKPFKMGSADPPMYSGVGYSDPLRPGGISFDFDCNGTETADPTNMYGAAPATCPSLSTNCGAIGYVPANPARSGTGVNPLCGSTTLRICAAEGLNCNAKLAETTPFRCR